MLPFPVYSSTSTVFAPAFIVIVSVPALVVIVVPVPAAIVNVSSTPSATISDCPDTDIVLNTFPPAVPQLAELHGPRQEEQQEGNRGSL